MSVGPQNHSADTQARTRLIGFQLWVARGIWILLAFAILVMEAKALLSYVEDRTTLCQDFCPDGYLWPQEADALSRIGLSAEFNAWYFLVVDAIPTVFTLVSVALLLAWKRSDDWLALCTSIFLISLANLKLPFVGPPFLIGGIAAYLILFTSTTLLPYVFPDGRFVPRWTAWIAVPVAGWNVLFTFMPEPIPFYFDWINVLLVFFAVAVLAYRYFHISDLTEKRRIQWVVLAFALRPTSELGLRRILFPMLFTVAYTPGLERVFFHWAIIPIFSTFPFIFTGVAMFVSILRYRLWDIDFVLNRSLVYGALTAALAAVFAGSMFVVSLFVEGQAFVLAFGFTALFAGLLFQPVRRRLQRFVDRTFYHIEIDYQKTPAPTPSSTNVIRQTDFGKYKNLELIGQGGMAEVYKSMHPTLNVPVAIKILPSLLANEPGFRKRFAREAELVSKLQHPNIIRVFDYGESDGTHYMVMEFILGEDLQQHLARQTRLSLKEALPILRGISDALDYAHREGIVHRDIKPSNILIAGGGENLFPKLTDFGIAKILGAGTRVTETGSVLGTFDYIAPEQIQDAPNVDGRADVYAFGIVAYQLLTGQLPFQHNNIGALLIAHLNQPAPDPRVIVSELPFGIASAIQRAMEKAPDQRYTTAGEFIHALEQAA